MSSIHWETRELPVSKNRKMYTLGRKLLHVRTEVWGFNKGVITLLGHPRAVWAEEFRFDGRARGLKVFQV